VIEVEDLTRYYGSFPAIQGVTFRAEKGEVLGFLGPNAAGKTTTMRILTGYMPATRGRARVAGFDVFENATEVKRRVGYLPENPPLYPEMTVRSYLNFVAKIKGVEAKERRKKVDQVMDVTAIRDVATHIIRTLSRGYKQRVGLAQALIHDPEVLILDEPTVGLDPKQRIEVRKLIRSLGGQRTIVLSTHILPDVEMTCERVVIINKGHVVAEDTPENLTRRLKGSEKLLVEVEGPQQAVMQKIRSVPGVTQVACEAAQDGIKGVYTIESRLNVDVRRDLARTIVESGWGLLEMRPVGMSLEEIFLQLTTKEEEVATS